MKLFNIHIHTYKTYHYYTLNSNSYGEELETFKRKQCSCGKHDIYLISNRYFRDFEDLNGELDKLPFERYKGKESYGSVRHRLLYAVIYGYETKPLYTVEIPNPNGSGYCKTYLAKNNEGKVELFTWSDYTSIELANGWKQEENAQLTEEEIKEDYAWAFKFAEEVTK